MVREFNVYIALLACGVAFVGIALTMTACDHFRNVVLKYGKPTVTQIIPSMTMIGILLGGVMIWGVHMIGFISMTLKNDDGNVVPIRFNIVVCFLGLVFSMVVSATGMYFNCKDRLYVKSKAEILEYFVSSIASDDILNYTEYQVFVLLITKELRYIISGGMLLAFGTIGVFFIIVSSIEFPGYIAWNGGILFGAMLVLFPSGVGACWIFFRFFSVYQDVELLRLTNIVFGGIITCVMHYFASLAADFRIDYKRTSAQPWSTGSVNKDDLLYPLLLATMIITWTFVMTMFADMRSKINSYRSYLQKVCPNEQLSDILRAAENGLEKGETAGVKVGGVKKNAVAPHPFNEHESPI